MNVYFVLLHLAGAVTLLLWAVRMVRTGVERSQEPALKRLLREGKGGRVRAAAVGGGVAIFLQSSTAVAVLTAGFAGTGALSLATALAMMLGADLGSALVVQILSIDLHFLVPALLLAGGTMFFRGSNRSMRQGGRIVMGVGLVLVSLQMISEATLPLRESEFIPAIAGYLSKDFVTTFLLGVAFTWIVHSSVAFILMVAAFAAHGLVPIEMGISLMLGANLGGGLIAIGLTRLGTVEAKRIAVGNCLFRGLGAVSALVAYKYTAPALDLLGPDASRQLINAHLLFNVALLVVFIPFTGSMAKVVERLLKQAIINEPELIVSSSCLDNDLLDRPALALASAKREVLRMAEIIERMLKPIMELYETGDAEKIKQIKQLEAAVNRAQFEIKIYLSRIEHADNASEEAKLGQDLSSFAINLEYVGDTIAKILLKLAQTRRDENLKFSPAGWRELGDLHHRVLQNLQLALNVLMSREKDSARQLLSEKEAVSRAGRASAAEHLQRLQTGAKKSITTSNIHLETVQALKTINSLLSSVAYPPLIESGELKPNRTFDDSDGAQDHVALR